MRRLFPAAAILCLALSAACMRSLNPTDTSDPGITARLRADLKGRPHLDISTVEIDAHSGIVTLSGIVEDFDQRDEIIRIARRLRGVRQVIANIVIRQ